MLEYRFFVINFSQDLGKDTYFSEKYSGIIDLLTCVFKYRLVYVIDFCNNLYLAVFDCGQLESRHKYK